jgi:hypothetical protein
LITEEPVATPPPDGGVTGGDGVVPLRDGVVAFEEVVDLDVQPTSAADAITTAMIARPPSRIRIDPRV